MGIPRPIPANRHRTTVGTYVGKATFGQPTRIMDDKTINLWRQIENGRRRGTKRGLLGKPARKAINDN